MWEEFPVQDKGEGKRTGKSRVSNVNPEAVMLNGGPSRCATKDRYHKVDINSNSKDDDRMK
jgi:hypothetical protein